MNSEFSDDERDAQALDDHAAIAQIDGPNDGDNDSDGNHRFFVIERDLRLSQSMLWQAQSEYYERAGIDAWRHNDVPSYVTTNPALAHSFAHVIFGYLRDLAAGGTRLDAGPPLHIVELGAATGRFGFYLLRAVLDLCDRGALGDVRLRYVLTDLPEENIAFWRDHPQLAPYVKRGQLDFARFDVTRDTALELRASGERLEPGSLEKPIIVVANYVFDGIPQDAFLFERGRVSEYLVSVASPDPEIDSASGVDLLSRVGLRFRARPISLPYYPDPIWNAILADYARDIPEGPVLFPSLTLRALDHLAALSGGRMLLCTSDKGDVTLDSVSERGDPEIAVHGSFSFSVNYHAIGAWFKKRGGEMWQTPHEQLSIHALAFVVGETRGKTHEDRAIETGLAYHLAFDRGGSDDFFRLRQGLDYHYDSLEHEHLLSLLRLSNHDPRVLSDMADALITRLPSVLPSQRADVVQAVMRTWANHYAIGEDHDQPFEFALILHAIEQHQAALHLFEESLRLHGPDPRTHFNIAMCLIALSRADEAARHFAEARRLGPSLASAIAMLRKEH